MDLIPEIKKAIQEFKEERKNPDINRMLILQERIAGLKVFLSELESDTYEAYLNAEQERKQECAKFVNEYDGGVSKAKEVLYLCEPIIGLYAEENKFKGHHTRLRNFRMSVSEFLESTKQRISHLKKEYEKEGN